ncbi:MAG: hypothetical protein ACJ72N_27405 [Labedaea sp.]
MSEEFWLDADLSGAGEFAEAAVSLALRVTVPAGRFDYLRARFPAVAGATVLGRIYDASGATLFSTSAFDTTTVDAWNKATISGGLSVAAGTYRLTQVVTRYVAKGGIFSGGNVVRGSFTGLESRFDSGDVAPSQSSAAGYFVDAGFTASSAGISQALPTVIDLSSATSLGRVKSRALGVATETDTSIVLGRKKARVLPIAAELDVSVDLGGAVSGGSGFRRVQGNPAGRMIQATPRGRRTA